MDTGAAPTRRPDDAERLTWQNPDTILTEAGLKPGDTLIDLGCGEGFFALPAARIVGPRGKVYGLDTRSQAIAAVQEKAARWGLGNLVLKVGRAEEVVLCDQCADIVFLGIVLHDFDDPALVLRNAARMLKPEGRLTNLDWKKEPMPWGPPLHIRFDPERATGLIEAAGFSLESTDTSARFHYVISARRKESR